MTLVRFTRAVDPYKSASVIYLRDGGILGLGGTADLEADEIAFLSDRFVLVPYTPDTSSDIESSNVIWVDYVEGSGMAYGLRDP